MPKGKTVSRKLAAAAVVGMFAVLAQPLAAQSWSDRILASASGWASWTSLAATEPTPPGASASVFDRAIVAAKAYVPDLPPATDIADQATGLFDRAVLMAKSYGPGFPTLDADVTQDPEKWSDTVRQSMGCLVTGSAGTTAALFAGGENLVNVIAGGVVSAANPVVLYVGLFGVVFASFCAVGQALTPLYIHYMEVPEPNPPGLNPNVPASPSVLPNARVFYISYP